MKPFRQLVPKTPAEVAQQMEAILTIDFFETRPEYREQIDLRVKILSDYLYIYNKHIDAEFYFIRDAIDNSLCLTCKN